MIASRLDHTRYLKRQVEFIRDTNTASIQEVVVKVRTPGQDDPTFVATVAEALRRRGLSSSARDLLPVSKRVLQASPEGGGRTRAADVKVLKSDDRSLAAQIAQADVSRAAHSALRKRNLGALRPLLNSDVVKQARADVLAERGKSKSKKLGMRAQPVHFWTSTSAVLAVRSQDLPKLIEAPNIQDIFPNQRLFVPPVVSPKQVPLSIEDNKVGA